MNDSTPLPTQMKRCSKCGEEKPATREYFYYNKTTKDGFLWRCIQCSKAYYHPLEKQQYYLDNKERIQQYRRENRAMLSESERRYRASHREYYREFHRLYHIAHRDEILKRKRETGPGYRARFADALRERMRRYHLVNINRFRLAGSKRRARVRSLPSTFTHEQWLACLEYWHNRCAVCGNQLRDLFGSIEPHFDHWIPISHEACPGTVVGNMVCLCSFCNLSKHHILPEIWLTRRYGKRKASQIMKRVQAYFEWAMARG